MNKALEELNKVNEKVRVKLNHLKKETAFSQNYINEVKHIKNCIFDKASRTFIYNLKKLIQIEGTQKNLAKKIGVSEDLLSKYKVGEAFPSIETLMYICEVYNISIDKFIGTALSISDLENLIDNQELEAGCFEELYYTYFLVTNLSKEGAVHEGLIEFQGCNVKFKIMSQEEIIKCFTGTYSVQDKLIDFNLSSAKDGTVFINMIKPNLNKNKYVGGSALLVLPSDANSKPCAQKLIFSKRRIDREEHYIELKNLLSFNSESTVFGNVKISQIDDENTYNFIRKHL